MIVFGSSLRVLIVIWLHRSRENTYEGHGRLVWYVLRTRAVGVSSKSKRIEEEQRTGLFVVPILGVAGYLGLILDCCENKENQPHISMFIRLGQSKE